VKVRWYEDVPELQGECPPLSAEELHRIALRQTYSLPALFALDDDEARTDALLADSIELDYAQLSDWLDSRDRADPFCVEVSE
jgi:hypothetical protein